MFRRVTTQDISWFIDLQNNNQLELNPPYQRKSVWSRKDRKFFLDTIFRGYPSPSIFLYKTSEEKTIYHVVDGKQRLETIIMFVNNELAIDKAYGDIRLAGKKWKDIEKFDTLKHSFWDYVLPVEFINVDSTGTFINEVFERLNRNSRKLVEQELRHAKYDGWLINFLEKEANRNEWKELGISTTSRAKRMKDIQFISELFMVPLNNCLTGFNQSKIDEMYALYEEPYDETLDLEFNESEIISKLEQVKTFILNCERKAQIVTTFAKDFKNFYSLWGAVALNLNRMPTDIKEFCDKYKAFMKNVDLCKNEDFFTEVDKNNETKNAYKYYKANTGASTEEPQRLMRHKILCNVFWGDAIDDEDTARD